MTYVLATSRPWHEPMAGRLEQKTGQPFTLITGKNELTVEHLSSIKPKIVFFPHWSYIIPEEIFENYECVIFHMTDLPFGRGGSPLQNLIARGITETKLSALKCVKELDGGPVYMKRPLSLYGSAEEIYLRAGKLIEEMIVEIIEKNPTPIEQEGEPVLFKRRKKAQSRIQNLENLEILFDHIRMLDADGYPPAFLEYDRFRFEFNRASLKAGKIIAEVKITEVSDE